MPFTKPYQLEDTNSKIRDEINLAGDFLSWAFSGPDLSYGLWTPAHLAIDMGGPWWDDLVNDFLRQSKANQKWILARIERTVKRGSMAIQREMDEAESDDRHPNWSWVWSQPTLISRPGRDARIPSITRPDLIVGLEDDTIDLIDIKTTTTNIDGLSESSFNVRFDEWEKILQSQGFEINSCRLLVLSSSRNKRHGGPQKRWIDLSR